MGKLRRAIAICMRRARALSAKLCCLTLKGPHGRSWRPLGLPILVKHLKWTFRRVCGACGAKRPRPATRLAVRVLGVMEEKDRGALSQSTRTRNQLTGWVSFRGRAPGGGRTRQVSEWAAVIVHPPCRCAPFSAAPVRALSPVSTFAAITCLRIRIQCVLVPAIFLD